MLAGFISLTFVGFWIVAKTDQPFKKSNMPAAHRFAKKTVAADAEFSTSTQIQLDEVSTNQNGTSQPLLPDDCPAWVGQVDQVDGETHRIVIASELMSSIEECRSKLDEALVTGVQHYVNENLSNDENVASKLIDLDANWIRSHLMGDNVEYEATLKRPTDTYHQLWVQLEISRQERETISRWIQQLETSKRASAVGLVGGSLVVCLALLNAGLKLFSKDF